MRLFLKFAAAGAVGTVIHYALLTLLVEWFAVAPAFAAFLGALAGGISNYALNFYFNFNAQATHLHALPKFALMVAVGAVLNAALVKFLNVFGMHYLIAQGIATALLLILNFFFSKLWIFKQKKAA